MKDIPEADILRAELRLLERRNAATVAAHTETSHLLAATAENEAILSDIVATMIHRAGEALIVVTDVERRAAWDACWCRISVDFLDDHSARVSLVPPTDDERKVNDANAAALKKSQTAEESPLKLLAADGETQLGD